MKLRTLFVPLFLLYVASLLRITWSTIDGEVASYTFQSIGFGLLSGKIPLILFTVAIAPFVRSIGNPIYRLGVFPCTLFIIASLSIFWTYNLGTTLFNLLSLFTLFAYALIATRLLGINTTLRAAWWLTGSVIALSTVLAMIGDPHALMGGIHEGRWRGVFAHKNVFSTILLVHFLTTLLGRRRIGVPWPIPAAFLILDGVALIGAESGTALIAAAAAVLAGLVFLPIASRELRYLWRVTSMIAALGVASVAVTSPDLILRATNRDPTLSNRTVMWAAVYDLTSAHKLGTGYGTGGGSQVSFQVQIATHRHDTQGVQSGYLNLALELGWITVAIFLMWLSWEIGATMFRRANLEDQMLFVALAVQHMIVSFSESFGCINASWSLFMLLIALSQVRVPQTLELTDDQAPLTQLV